MDTGHEQDSFLTQDLSAAAALWAAGAEFLGLHPKSHRTYLFVFRNHAACRHLADGYDAGTLHVSAKRFADCERTLKDRIFSALRDRDDSQAPYPGRRQR